MTRFLAGMFTVSLLLIAWHVRLRHDFYRLFRRGDENDYGDVCKQPTYRYYGERLVHD